MQALLPAAFFSRPGRLPAAGMYSAAHIIMLIIAAAAIAIALVFSVRLSKRTIRRIIRYITAGLWLLEAAKIAFNFAVDNAGSPNSYMPLYFCSIVLYAGLLSSICTGRLQRAGDVFLATGSIVGGAVFLAVPLTSLTMYPAIHFISFHSIILHSVMVYMGLMLLLSGNMRLCGHDVLYHALLVLIVCAAALVVNLCFDANLMFISKNYPDSPIEIIYNLFPGAWYTVIMCAGQAVVPFYIVYLLYRLFGGGRYKKSVNM